MHPRNFFILLCILMLSLGAAVIWLTTGFTQIFWSAYFTLMMLGLLMKGFQNSYFGANRYAKAEAYAKKRNFDHDTIADYEYTIANLRQMQEDCPHGSYDARKTSCNARLQERRLRVRR